MQGYCNHYLLIKYYSSTGNYMTLFKVDTINFPSNVYSRNVPIEFGHDVVWHHKAQKLWTASLEKMKVFTYNFNFNAPDEVIDINGNSMFYLQGMKIYKARWLVENRFSYPEVNNFKQSGS